VIAGVELGQARTTTSVLVLRTIVLRRKKSLRLPLYMHVISLKEFPFHYHPAMFVVNFLYEHLKPALLLCFMCSMLFVAFLSSRVWVKPGVLSFALLLLLSYTVYLCPCIQGMEQRRISRLCENESATSVTEYTDARPVYRSFAVKSGT